MANNISVSQIVANMALAEFKNNNSLVMTASRDYEYEFMNPYYKTGDTINIRKQNHFLVNNSRIANVQDVIEETEALTISNYNSVDIAFTSQELALDVDTSVDRFNERYVRPAVQELVHNIEGLIALQSISELNYQVGAPATPINSFAAVDLVGAKMLEQAMPMLNNAYMGLTVRDGSALKASLQNAFNDTLNEDISFYSRLGHLSYFDIFQNQALARHTSGSNAGTPVTAAIVTSGSTISASGYTVSTANVLRAGDIITIGTFGAASAVNAVNPVGRADTGQLMQFRVTADVSSDGAGLATIPIAPAIISDPANPRRNVSQAIPAGAAIGLVTANTTHNINLAYCERGLDLAVVPLPTLHGMDSSVATDKDSRISLRVNIQGDNQNDLSLMRIAVLWGAKWHPEYAVRVVS